MRTEAALGSRRAILFKGEAVERNGDFRRNLILAFHSSSDSGPTMSALFAFFFA